jgi:hypothetical protein
VGPAGSALRPARPPARGEPAAAAGPPDRAGRGPRRPGADRDVHSEPGPGDADTPDGRAGAARQDAVAGGTGNRDDGRRPDGPASGPDADARDLAHRPAGVAERTARHPPARRRAARARSLSGASRPDDRQRTGDGSCRRAPTAGSVARTTRVTGTGRSACSARVAGTSSVTGTSSAATSSVARSISGARTRSVACSISGARTSSVTGRGCLAGTPRGTAAGGFTSGHNTACSSERALSTRDATGIRVVAPTRRAATTGRPASADAGGAHPFRVRAHPFGARPRPFGARAHPFGARAHPFDVRASIPRPSHGRRRGHGGDPPPGAAGPAGP